MKNYLPSPPPPPPPLPSFPSRMIPTSYLIFPVIWPDGRWRTTADFTTSFLPSSRFLHLGINQENMVCVPAQCLFVCLFCFCFCFFGGGGGGGGSIPPMFIGTINFCLLKPLSLTLSLAEGQKISAKQNILACFSQSLLTDQDEIWKGVEAIEVEHPDAAFEWDLMKQREITAVLLRQTASTLTCLWINLVRTWYDEIYC